jgi:hypothetical protein
MGGGDFGSNGSVHWRIKYDDASKYADHVDIDDSLEHAQIGTSKKHPGKFRVTARYNTVKEARQAIGELLARFKKNPRKVIHLDVNVRPEDTVCDDPGHHNDWEIRVDW